MNGPYYSVISGPGERDRSYRCSITGKLYTYSKGSSTDGVDAKAQAMAQLTHEQNGVVDEMMTAGIACNLDLYDPNRLRDAYSRMPV